MSRQLARDEASSLPSSTNMVPSMMYHPVGGRHPITEQSGRFTKKITPGWGAHCARHTAANVHSLDGYTCQGTPSLMDGPQIKQTISSGATLGSALDTLDTPSTARQLDSSTALDSLDSSGAPSHPRQPSTALDSTRQHSTASTAAVKLSSSTARQSRQSRQYT